MCVIVSLDKARGTHFLRFLWGEGIEWQLFPWLMPARPTVAGTDAEVERSITATIDVLNVEMKIKKTLKTLKNVGKI